ncbi:MAG: aryl-sulfate sulfotransferase [Planctomycetota bacterium]|nr:aryl-sulfate sulfotransferase [Planctomycetota bacterium]
MSCTRTLLLATALFAASSCHDNATDTAQPTPAQTLPPAFVQVPLLEPNPEPTVPLAAVLTLETDRPTQVELGFDDGIRQWEVVIGGYSEVHERIPVLGMRPGLTHQITVVVRDEDGQATDAPTTLEFTTPDLPADFPDLQVTTTSPEEQEPGVFLVNARALEQPAIAYVFMVDQEGEVVWYYDANQRPYTANQFASAYRTSNGHLLVINGRQSCYEMDMLGNLQGAWLANRLVTPPTPAGTVMVDTDTMHHEIRDLPPGSGADFVVISSEMRTLPNYPSSVITPWVTNLETEVIGDLLVEFNRDGTIVREISLFDLLDPYRVTYDSLLGFWNPTYQASATADWSHGNAVYYDDRDDSYLVSLRHQDALIKIDRTTTELRWILGDPARWEWPWSTKLLRPIGNEFEWQYHQHGPEITPEGTILLFDNGNGRAIPPVEALPLDGAYSRAVEYRVDEAAMTVEQVWAYGGKFDPENHFYSAFLGDARLMPQTGNVLVTDGARTTSAAPVRRNGRIAEVTRTTPPRVLFEMFVLDDSPTDPHNWTVYRAVHLPSVYPD